MALKSACAIACVFIRMCNACILCESYAIDAILVSGPLASSHLARVTHLKRHDTLNSKQDSTLREAVMPHFGLWVHWLADTSIVRFDYECATTKKPLVQNRTRFDTTKIDSFKFASIFLFAIAQRFCKHNQTISWTKIESDHHTYNSRGYRLWTIHGTDSIQ